MLNYAPDGMAGGRSDVCEREWAISWESDGLPDASLLLNFIAASREAKPVSQPNTARVRAPAVFQPERMSGFCASS